MAVTLGGVTLSDSMRWVDRYGSTQVVQQRRRSLGGRQFITAAQLVSGRPITLVSTEDYGWLSKADAIAILAMADLVGVVQTLVFGAETFSVVFRHDEPPACELIPLLPRVEDEDTDFFIGTIKLVTV